MFTFYERGKSELFQTFHLNKKYLFSQNGILERLSRAHDSSVPILDLQFSLFFSLDKINFPRQSVRTPQA